MSYGKCECGHYWSVHHKKRFKNYKLSKKERCYECDCKDFAKQDNGEKYGCMGCKFTSTKIKDFKKIKGDPYHYCKKCFASQGLGENDERN